MMEQKLDTGWNQVIQFAIADQISSQAPDSTLRPQNYYQTHCGHCCSAQGGALLSLACED